MMHPHCGCGDRDEAPPPLRPHLGVRAFGSAVAVGPSEKRAERPFAAPLAVSKRSRCALGGGGAAMDGRTPDDGEGAE